MEKKRKNVKNLKNILLFRHFTLEIFNRGVFFPITLTPKYSTTVPNSVNHTQDFMCIKFKALLPFKLHPSANVTCQSCVMCAHVGGTLCHHIWKNKDGVMKQGLICDAHLLSIPAMWNTRPTVHP